TEMRILRVRYRSGEEFLRTYLDSLENGGLFYATREGLRVGEPLLLEIRFPELANNQMVRAKVAWRRAGKHRTKVRAGVGLGFAAPEPRRRDFLAAVAKGDVVDMVARRHRRLPVSLTADWRVALDRDVRKSSVEDIGPGGAFLRTTDFLPP